MSHRQMSQMKDFHKGMTCYALTLVIVLAACTGDIAPPTLTPTHQFTGPTTEPSPVRFTGPPTEGPPPQNGAVGQSNATAAALSNQEALPPLAVNTPQLSRQPVEVTSADGSLLVGDLYQQGDVRQPGVLLLGPEGSSWGDFPLRLNEAGFTVLVMSIGEGVDQTDVSAMLGALGSGIADPGRIGAVGAAEGADGVLRGCVANAVCDTVVLMSPLDETGLLNVLPGYNPRPIMLVASEEDAETYATAQALNDAAIGDKLFQPFVSAGRGTTILTNRPDLGDLIIDWLRRTLG